MKENISERKKKNQGEKARKEKVLKRGKEKKETSNWRRNTEVNDH